MAAKKKDELDLGAHKIHLVADDREQGGTCAEFTEAPRTSNRIEIGEYIADILVDKRSYPVVVHWIVQRRGSPDILQWGHEDSFEAATREAVAWIDSLVRYDAYRKNLQR